MLSRAISRDEKIRVHVRLSTVEFGQTFVLETMNGCFLLRMHDGDGFSRRRLPIHRRARLLPVMQLPDVRQARASQPRRLRALRMRHLPAWSARQQRGVADPRPPADPQESALQKALAAFGQAIGREIQTLYGWLNQVYRRASKLRLRSFVPGSTRLPVPARIAPGLSAGWRQRCRIPHWRCSRRRKPLSSTPRFPNHSYRRRW